MDNKTNPELIVCPSCSNGVSKYAVWCPTCGCNFMQRFICKYFWWAVLTLAIIAIVYGLIILALDSSGKSNGDGDFVAPPSAEPSTMIEQEEIK